MSTKYGANTRSKFSVAQGYEGSNIPEEFDIPSNSIEDVDKSVFDLFNKKLPFQYDKMGTMSRVPVIFAAGERFATLRRKEPLRDKSGALILPIISIMRTGIAQTNTVGLGMSEIETQVIKRKISSEDQYYQRLLNIRKEKNSLDLAVDPNEKNKLKSERKEPFETQEGFGSFLGKNIYEILEIPAVKFFTATYEITFWTQYTQQMNDILTALMNLYQNNAQRTLKLETSKGYWFVGYVGEQMSPNDNFDNFLDEERIIKYTVEMTVPSYIVNSSFPGSMKPIRKFLSAPEVSFAAWYDTEESLADNSNMGIPSAKTEDYILENLRVKGEPPLAQSIVLKRKATHSSKTIWNKNNNETLDNMFIKNYKPNLQGETTFKGVDVIFYKKTKNNN
jgi:hypothetical protein